MLLLFGLSSFFAPVFCGCFWRICRKNHGFHCFNRLIFRLSFKVVVSCLRINLVVHCCASVSHKNTATAAGCSNILIVAGIIIVIVFVIFMLLIICIINIIVINMNIIISLSKIIMNIISFMTLSV